MKTTFLVLLFFCATGGFAQVGGGSISGPTLTQPFSMATHTSHAAPQQMAPKQSLLEGSGQVYIAHGERPLWEVAPPEPPTVPLGDIARMLKKEHATAKKAQFVYEQYGPAAN
jgi:hypothetical protein